MAPKNRRRGLKIGDRVRDKITGRTGKVSDVTGGDGQRQYSVSYDEAPQDRYITTPLKDGAQRVPEMLEPEN